MWPISSSRFGRLLRDARDGPTQATKTGRGRGPCTLRKRAPPRSPERVASAAGGDTAVRLPLNHGPVAPTPSYLCPCVCDSTHGLKQARRAAAHSSTGIGRHALVRLYVRVCTQPGAACACAWRRGVCSSDLVRSCLCPVCRVRGMVVFKSHCGWLALDDFEGAS
jgi:hypothetical protein